MDLTLNEEQEMIRKGARDFFEIECPKSLVRDMMADTRGYSPELWGKMADLGWQGMMLPQGYGGAGATFIDIIMLVEEMGRALAPIPFVPTAILGALAVLNAGTREQKQKFLPKIARGKLILAMPLEEFANDFKAEGVSTYATEEGSYYELNHTWHLVPDAHIADYLVCAARTNDSSSGHEGISLFILDTKSPGIICIPRTAFDGKKLCEVKLDNVKVPKTNLLGQVHMVWPLLRKLIDYNLVALCAEALGGAQLVMEMSAKYATERIQFGRPIGTNQAIKHKCSNMFINLESARSITYWAAWAIDNQNTEASLAASMAKMWCSDMYRQITADALQIHGGIGFTWDCDIHLYLKRAKMIEYALGDADYHRELIAQELGKMNPFDWLV
jgi:alkylation response protein AidB-like acyl-CoA dehydrogenase